MRANKGNIIIAVGLLVIGAFTLGLYVGEGRIDEVEKVAGLLNKEGDYLTAQVVGMGTQEYDFAPYWRVWNTLERKFIPFSTSSEPVTAEDRMYRSIEGLVASYNDPYTVFMRPQVAKDFKIATKGSLEGIGAVIGERDGGIVVVGPLKDSPAERAGLLPNDKIYSVDGVSISGMTVDEAVALIRGEGGTTVTLNVETGSEGARDVPIVRGTIEIPSTAHAVIEREVPKIVVRDPLPIGEERPTSDTGGDVVPDEEPVETEVRDFYLLRLFSFSQTSIQAFERELNDFVENGAESLIIDLRGNPGGYIESAVQIASWFLHEGDVVVREYNGPEKKEVLHTATGRSLFKEKLPKIAVLVDGSSASASEILAGALQEHGVATIVGTNTFGKGSVQELINITDDLSLKVTVARWHTPNGVSISDGGLSPDVRIDPATATSSDPWIDAAVEVLSSTG